MSYSTLSPGISPLRIQKGGSRSPSPTKDAPLPPMHPSPTPYTLKPRKASNSSITREGSRRTSSSYSAMRTNSLVKNSPFLNGSEPVGPKHRPAPSGFNVYRNGPPPPSARSSLHISASSSSERGSLSGPRPQSKIPTPSRRTSTSSHSMGLAMVPVSSEEGAPPNAHKGYKRRQSKGLQSLPDHERVSKSPFMNSVVERDTPSPHHERVHSPGEDEWDTVPETSPELRASTSEDPIPDFPAVPEREPTPPPPPPKPSVSPPNKPSLSSRLAAITAKAFSPSPPSTPPRQDSFSRGDTSLSGRLDTTSLPSTPIQTFPLELAGTPDSAYKTPISPSHAATPVASSTPIRGTTPLHISTPRDTPTKLDTSSSSLIIHPTPSPSSSPRRRPPSAQSPSPTRSSLVSKRLLGPRSSPSPRSPTTAGDVSISRTSSGRVARKLSRRNSRAARKASGGKYIAVTRRGSRKARKRVTFDERCDVLEFDSEVGIDGEVWSDEELWEEEPKKRYGSPPLEVGRDSPELEDRRSPELEDRRASIENKRHSTPPAQPGWSSWGNGSVGTPPLAHGSKYANIGVEEDYGFGRQAGLRHSGSGSSGRVGTQRVTGSAYNRSRDTGRDSDTGSLLASLSGSLSGHGSADSGLTAADAFGRAYPLKVVNAAPGDVDSPEVGWEERAKEAGERARREGEERVRKEEEQTRREEERARKEEARRKEQARLREEEEELARLEEQARREEEERARIEEARRLEAEEHSRSMAEVVVQHSGSAVVVHHTGGRPGVVVHHSGNGMVESVYSREGHEGDASIDQGVAVHHSGHSAVQIYDERSPDLSVADVSMANGMSFASLVSFDSIISRSGMGASRIGFGSSSGLGDHGRIEEEEEDSELVGGKILSGLDEVVIKSEEVSVDLGDTSHIEEDSPRRSTRDEPASPNVRHSAHLDSRPYTPRHLAPTLETRHSSPNLSGRLMEPQFTGGSVSGRSPRISRDDVLRKLMDRRTGGSLTPTGRASPREESPVPEGRSINGPRMSGSRIEIERLMAGVARGFADLSGEGSSMGFNPADESHSSLPYRKHIEEEEEEEETEPEPEPRREPVRVVLPRAPMQSATDSVASSGETETEIEEAITPPIGRSLIPTPRALEPGRRSSAYDSPSQRSSMYETSSQRSSTYEPKRLSVLDPGRASNIMNERPTSYMSVTSTSSKPEMSGKEKIKAHEEMILQKRRELRGGPSRTARRRSKSVSEAVVIGDKLDLLDVPVDNEELALEDSFNEQIRKIHDQDEGRTYHLREPNRTIHADDKVAHHRRAGDVDNGKAWRTVRRPSDMNEYAKEIQEIRAQAGTTKAHGKVFVKVRCLQKLCVPIPQHPTYFTCTLNNGIHFVTTPECRLEPNAMIDQEFELIEHGKLAFSLTIKVRKDEHIVNQIRRMAAPPPQQFMPAPPPKQGGFRSFFSSTPKKQPKRALLRRPDPVTEDHLVRYMKADGAIGRAYINFRDIVQRCDTRLFETSYPLIGEWSEDSVRGGAGGIPSSMMSGHMSQRPIGELVLHIFRLPPLPGVPPETLPQSLEECHRGLSAVAWHKKIYYQGILTQNGGDILTWRRRQFRIIGSNLVAYNDVTGKAMATINLKRALAVEDDQQPLPAGAVPGRRQRDESDAFFVDKRCFRLLFGKDDDIAFYADTPEEKAEWLRILRALVGNIPPHPLWAELVWQRHEQAAAAQALAQQQAQAQANSASPGAQPSQTPPPPPKPEPQVPPPRPQAWR